MAMEKTSFINGGGARLLALAIAVLMFGIIIVKWPEELKNFANSFSDNQQAQLLTPKGVERIAVDNPGLDKCLEERVGHVDQMLADGLISDEQHGQFANRASNLCRSQFPNP